jgi:hypothetical protein
MSKKSGKNDEKLIEEVNLDDIDMFDNVKEEELEPDEEDLLYENEFDDFEELGDLVLEPKKEK